ncbi:SUN domain-containing protein 1 isoform X1 [Ascaphus truei]|uniref:SUN domain-containing protein 1 isoform X1 n=2 Tax=Ascaphus truei TaxID=8439 RepID=UPI003F59F30D
MDYSHLHTYAPPQCLPEDTGYTYALSSSYSSAALDFETFHKLDPVYDSPRMSRRSLRLRTSTGSYSMDDAHNESFSSNISSTGSVSSKDRLSNRAVGQHQNISKKSSVTIYHTPRISLSNSLLSQSSFNSHVGDTSMVSTVLDESLIREQTEVDHLWGLDDDDLKGGDTTVIQANGDLNTAETQTTMINGYTCSDCSMLSERTDVLTAYSASNAASANLHTASSKVFFRDRIQKHKSREMPFYMHKTILLVKNTALSLAALVVHLFHTVMLKLGCESKAHSNYCGSMNVKDFLKEDGHLTGESLCDDCKGMKHLETHTTVHMQSSRCKRVSGSLWHIFSYTGYFLLQAARSVGAAGWFVSRKMLSFLWLAIVSPGKAASGIFWWLGTGWYQLVTLISLLNVFILTRCLPKLSKMLFLLIPLLLLLGLWFWGFEGLLALLPVFGGSSEYTTQRAEDLPNLKPTPDFTISSHEKRAVDKQFDIGRMTELEKQIASMAIKHSRHEEEYGKVMLLVLTIQEQVKQMNDKSQMSTMITNVLNEHFAGIRVDKKDQTMGDAFAINKEYELRVLHLEELVGKLSEKMKEDWKLAQSSTGGDIQKDDILRRVQTLEQQLAEYKSEFLKGHSTKTSCEQADCVLQKVDAKVRESVQMMFVSEENLPESLQQWLSSHYVSKGDFHTVLQGLERKILQNLTQYVAITKQMPTSKVVQRAVTGISGITEEDAHIIVNNALKLYSQDKTGMVDFALESGGGSILGTRCSETYETKTALMSLFGIPLWYFSQSPRVVIQPDMNPGNCWAFKGADGYLVVRLSMSIYPTAFSLEHIAKSLSPTGNITSAPKDFAVHGLEDEYQENGSLLVRSIYDQNGDSLQVFQVTEENKKPFQIVELRIFSNWGHTDYTCLYRFRAHGTPAK